MAGSITDNAAIYKKTFTYVPPTPPSELIDSTNYTLNFVKRKFIHIGIDPTDMFRGVVHLITPSRYINISTEFLKRIFSLMGIIYFGAAGELFSMMYSGENSLVIESKIHDGCRILLNRTELIRLLYLEWCIFESIVRKSTIMYPIVLKQFDIFTNYINGELSKVESLTRTSEEMTTFIKNVRDEHIIASSLKMYALAQLTEHCMQRWNGKCLQSRLMVI
ncbi:hypothetical protein AGLY_003270 [Aphis glycines]|uniref:Uncharacterized protein n=1 Tax=Aphis glycines TaxID=307491 RepID=A0A6G0U1B0_APHGL|nr:hypothetical protein AGLY_003270 [Aphis glycines]